MQTQTQKIQQLWAINEYQKTAYPSRAHTHTHEKDEEKAKRERKWTKLSKKKNNKVAKANESRENELTTPFEEKAKPRKQCAKRSAARRHRA